MVETLFPIQVSALTVKRRGKVLLSSLDADLKDTPVTLVIGPNGAGKSTFLKSLHGLERISSGQVSYACTTKKAQQKQSFVFQSPIMMRRSVLENLTYPLLLRGVSKKVASSSALSWAERVGLNTLTSQSATRLSGGEKQKLALARALICEPELVFLDEPCANLDGQSTGEIETLIQESAAQGVRFFLATHNMGQAKRLGTSVLFLNKGELVEQKTASEFFENPQSPEARAFLKGDIVT